MLFVRPAVVALSAATLAVVTTSAPSFAGTFSKVSINSATSVYIDSAPDSLSNTTGAAIEVGAAGTNNFAFTNGPGNYTVKPTTDDVFARASLATAELKARSVLGFGTNGSVVGAPMPVGRANGSSSATASFADSFSTYAGSSPFVWSTGDNASFQFGITGDYTVPAGIAPPTGSPAPKNQIYASLQFQAYAPGGLATLDQLSNFDFVNRPMSEYYALLDLLDAKRINGSSAFWYLGDPIAPFPVGSTPVLAVNPTTPTNVSVAFNPNGDFEWLLTLDTLIQLDATLQNTSVTLDFSHTIQTTYTSPAGTTTFSSSGLFPNTLPVPEPATLSLLLPLSLAASRRRACR
jgi:hypothetical protein